ncbi:MAG: hypothetical protein ACRENI_00605 [Gemmatimonadaceae bacterium]
MRRTFKSLDDITRALDEGQVGPGDSLHIPESLLGSWSPTQFAWFSEQLSSRDLDWKMRWDLGWTLIDVREAGSPE